MYHGEKIVITAFLQNIFTKASLQNITNKVNAALSILRRLREIVDYRTLITIYQSIIQPHFDYCSQVWGCLGKGLSDKLQKLQNRAFRIITRESYEIRSVDILEKVGVSNLQARREHQLALLMFKVKNKMLPNHLTEISPTRIQYILIIREIANSISHYLSQKQTT